MKTAIFWTRKGCRKPKMQGTATAVCSAATIRDMRRMALAGKGRLYIVDCDSAAGGRHIIKTYLSDNEYPGAMIANLDEGRTIAIGARAVMAISGAAESIRNWDGRLAARGRVTERESKALRGDDSDLDRLNVSDLFGAPS